MCHCDIKPQQVQTTEEKALDSGNRVQIYTVEKNKIKKASTCFKLFKKVIRIRTQFTFSKQLVFYFLKYVKYHRQHSQLNVLPLSFNEALK